MAGVQIMMGKGKLIIIGIYRPPNGNFNNFLQILTEELNSLHSLSSKIIVSGDFNIDLSFDSSRKNDLLIAMQEFGLHQLQQFLSLHK